LSESRKFGLSLTLAHQFISQLDPQVRDAVLGNSATIVSFRLGARDAPLLAEALDWSADDLKDLPRGKARCRTIVDGGPTSAFLVETKMHRLKRGYLGGNIRYTRARHSRPRNMVEDMLRPKRSRNRTWGWGNG
jgi:DNA helicase HerA-like ATPase